MAEIKVLLVDDDEVLRTSLTAVLDQSGFLVTCAANVAEALKLISGVERFDVLLSDLHMPGAGDGLTVVSAMRHANPLAVTLLLSAFPEMTAATQAILLQTDEILVKPMDVASLIQVIRQRVAGGPVRSREIETVAAILARTVTCIIDDWYKRVQGDPKVMSVAMGRELRCAHLPALFVELIGRLETPKPIGSKELPSSSAAGHGVDRFRQGYSASMLVEESRMLQISIFYSLQANLTSIDYSVLLIGVMTIADHMDFQLGQAISSFTQATSAASYHLISESP